MMLFTFIRRFSTFTLLSLLSFSVLAATTNELSQDHAAQSILANQFSIDPQKELIVSQQLLPEDDIGLRAEIEFTSDDDHNVNGILAYPPKHIKATKLALLMHPMGSSQNVWWDDKSPIAGKEITTTLRTQGYVVITLDARRHGKRSELNFGARQLIQNARSDYPRLYTDTIIGSVRDYRQIMNWAITDLSLEPNSVFAAGYSMGAQMSLLFSAYESQVNKTLAMVPPFVARFQSPVAPRNHVGQTQNDVMLLLAKKDPYSSTEQNKALVDAFINDNHEIKYFDSGHLLPKSYSKDAVAFIEKDVTEKK